MTSSEERATLYGFRNNLVVAASAGTGKTHALVGVLVHLAMGASDQEGGGLCEPVPLHRIVATTFSRKAAAEIRARLVRELTRLASLDPKAAYRTDILLACDRAGAPRFDGDELAERAKRALDGVGRARIGTLHGFAGAIVREHGLALGWAPGFEVEAEEETEDRAREAASGAIEKLLRDDEAGARSLLRLAGGGGPLIDRVATLLAQLSEDGRDPSKLTVAAGEARTIEERLDLFLTHARDLCEDETLGTLARGLCDAWSSGDVGRMEVAASELSGRTARGRTSERAQAFFEFRLGLPGANHAERGKNLVKLWRAREQTLPQAELFKTLLVRAGAALRASMVRDSVLGYGEVLGAARDILARSPKAAGDLGRGLDALLVDEFQDTSRVQRDIVELAWQDPSRAATHASLPRIARVRRRGLLVVGDRKQSIYAVPGADVGSFAELCVGLAGRRAREALRVAPGTVWEPEEPSADFVALRENRRSAPAILSFVNAYSRTRLVASSEPAELYEVKYAPSIEDLLPAGDTAWEGYDFPRVSWIRVATGRGVTSSRMSEAEAIARRIGAMLEEGTPRVGSAPPRPKDMAVLAVRNAMLDATAHALARAGIPYVVAGNGFFAAREVEDMLAMLAFVVDPDDVVARVAVLRGVWCGASDQTLIALTDPHAGVTDGGAWATGERRKNVREEDKPRVDALHDVVLGLRDAAASIGPAETLRQAARALRLEETLIQLPRGEQRVANVRKLVDLADRETDARAFLARVRRASDEERPEPEAATFSEEDDAVRLLTVHASKGLDFPIVFLPEAGACPRAPERSPMVLQLGGEEAKLAMRVLDDEGRAHDTPAYAQAQTEATRRELAEWARLSYVAATRAKEAIVFVGDRRVPRGAPTDAYRSTTAAALAALAEREASTGTPRLLTVESEPGPIVASRRAFSDPTMALPDGVGKPASFEVAMTAPELADFAVCPRRFQLARLVGLPESAWGSPRREAMALGEAYAAKATREGATVERRRLYLARAASGGVVATVRGTVDLWIERPGDATEALVLSPEPGVSPRAEVLAELAAFATVESGKSPRVGVLPYGSVTPVWPTVAGTPERLLGWVTACVEARWTRSFVRAPVMTCHAIDCGYVSLCHPDYDSSTAMPPSAR